MVGLLAALAVLGASGCGDGGVTDPGASLTVSSVWTLTVTETWDDGGLEFVIGLNLITVGKTVGGCGEVTFSSYGNALHGTVDRAKALTDLNGRWEGTTLHLERVNFPVDPPGVERDIPIANFEGLYTRTTGSNPDADCDTNT